MRALGIIVEYNPFHNGHLYHVQASKRITGCDCVVAVMSGHYVQRGEPALCDKWRRTRMALLNGVDLVIELPVYYAAAGADYFARGAVGLLNATGIVDCLCFGSESCDMETTRTAASVLVKEPPAFIETLHGYLKEGSSYPAARMRALAAVMPLPGDWLIKPNNILGVEYCKALTRLSSSIEPFTIARAEEAPESVYRSARTIRNAVLGNNYEIAKTAMPPSAWEILSDALQADGAAHMDAFSDLFQYLMRTRSDVDLRRTADMTEGLENRFMSCAGRHRVLSDVLMAVKTKRYTYTRLQRVALHVLLGIEAEKRDAFEQAGGPQYIRVLGFRRESTHLLGELRRNASLPVITNLKQARTVLSPLAMEMLEKEIESTGLYTLAFKKSIHEKAHEYSKPLVIV